MSAMNCIIPGLNLKVIARALQALAKIGDELFVEAHRDKLTLISLNMAKTICMRFHFLDSFFSSYEVNESDFTEKCEAITCKIHMRILLPLFKGTHLEKKLDFVKLEYETNGDFILFKMKFKCDDILMIHNLRLMETESLTLAMRPDAGSNNILATSSFFNQLLTMFSNTDNEITLEVSKEKVIARNYVVGGNLTNKSVRSQVNLIASEFSTYQINSETAINFSLKPLRTAIHFAEGFNLNVGINFETGGKPLCIIMKNPTFEVNVIVATLNPYSDLHSSMATTSIPTKITQHRQENANITIEDQEALLNENWDEFEMDTEPVNTKSDDNSKKRNFQQIIENAKKGSVCEDKSGNKNRNSGKIFNLPQYSAPMEVDSDNSDVLPASPESPRSKKAKLVFGRCFEPTFSETCLGEVLAPNSDSE